LTGSATSVGRSANHFYLDGRICIASTRHVFDTPSHQKNGNCPIGWRVAHPNQRDDVDARLNWPFPMAGVFTGSSA
jgi:hypothetical protein